MDYTGDVGAYLSGAQIRIPQCGLFVTPPTVRQVEQLGEDDFLLCVRMLSADWAFMDAVKRDVPSMKDVPDIQVILAVINSDEQAKEKVRQFMELLCPGFDVEFTKNSINVKDPSDGTVRGQINPFNSKYFSTTVKELLWPPVKNEDAFDPANDKAREIARKLEEGRKLREREKGKSGNGGSLFALYASVLSVGLGIDINSVYDYTPFQLYDSFDRYVKKVQYDLYMKIRTTPMMSTENMEEPEHWMSGLYRHVDGEDK